LQYLSVFDVVTKQIVLIGVIKSLKLVCFTCTIAVSHAHWIFFNKKNYTSGHGISKMWSVFIALSKKPKTFRISFWFQLIKIKLIVFTSDYFVIIEDTSHCDTLRLQPLIDTRFFNIKIFTYQIFKKKILSKKKSSNKNLFCQRGIRLILNYEINVEIWYGFYKIQLFF